MQESISQDHFVVTSLGNETIAEKMTMFKNQRSRGIKIDGVSQGEGKEIGEKR